MSIHPLRMTSIQVEVDTAEPSRASGTSSSRLGKGGAATSCLNHSTQHYSVLFLDWFLFPMDPSPSHGFRILTVTPRTSPHASNLSPSPGSLPTRATT
jgi:hypothetical protein